MRLNAEFHGIYDARKREQEREFLIAPEDRKLIGGTF